MINTWGPDLNYTPEYWPVWLKLFAVIILLALLAVAAHALLRFIFNKTAEEGETHKTYIYILPVRIWHWLNAGFFLTLLTMGLLNHFSIGNTKIMVICHKYMGMAYIAIWILFIVIGVITGNIRQYAVRWSGFVGRILRQAKYYMSGILKGEPHPFETTEKNKFNPIQQVTYIGVVFMMIPLIIITGVTALFAHSAFMLKIHSALGVVGLIFLLVHLYMCTTGGKPLDLIKGMLDGYHRDHSEQK
jgi:thiosulfate reductase cytochrome b subunit